MYLIFLVVFTSLIDWSLAATNYVPYKFCGASWTSRNTSEIGRPWSNFIRSSSAALTQKGELKVGLFWNGNSWIAGEACSNNQYKYGIFNTKITSSIIDQLPTNIILALFLIPSDGKVRSEIDIEMTKWQKIRDQNTDFTIHSQYTKQKHSQSFYRYRPSDNRTIFRIVWTPFVVILQGYYGHQYLASNRFSRMVINQSQFVPKMGMRYCINVWKFRIQKQFQNKQDKYMIVNSYEYLPGFGFNWANYSWYPYNKQTFINLKSRVRFSLSNVDNTDPGKLKLSVRREGWRWIGSEVVSLDEFSYGLFIFKFSVDLKDLNPNVVITFKLGRSQQQSAEQMQVHLSRFGKPEGMNMWFRLAASNYTEYNQSITNYAANTISINWIQQGLQLSLGSSRFDVLRGELVPNSTMPVRMRIWMMDSADHQQQQYSITVQDFQYQKQSA